MNLQFKLWAVMFTAMFLLYDGPVAEAQPGNGHGPQSGMADRGSAPGGFGRNGGPPGSPFNAPSSPYAGPGGPSFPSGPSMSGPGRSRLPQGPVQPTRFGSAPGGNSSGPSISRNPGPGSSSHGPHGIGPSPADTSRMQQALRQGDYQAIEKESQGVRNRAKDMQNPGPDMPVQDRLKLTLINQMYRQGADTVDDGRSKQDKSKINYGIQQINEANDRLNRLKDSDGHPPSRPGPRQERGSGRRER